MGNPLQIGAGIAGGPLGFAVSKGAPGGGKKGQAPPPPDYKGAAEQTAVGNRPNQSTPFASSTWSTGPDGRPVQTTDLSGPLGDAAKGIEGQVGSAWSNPLDNGAQARQHAEDAIYGRETSRLDPRFSQEEDRLKASLAAQGLAPGSEAYDKAYGNFSRGKTDAYQQALYGAITGGGAEASRQQGLDLTSRMAPLSALSGLHGLTSMPGFQPGPNYLAAAMAQGNYGLGSTELNNQAMADYWSGITGAAKGAGEVAMASDERVKTGVHRLPVEAEPGVPFALFKYRADPEKRQHVGVIAQDLEKVRPEAVASGPDGVKRVASKYAPVPLRARRSGAAARPFSLGA